MKYALGSETMSRIRGRAQRFLRIFTRITSAAMTKRNAAATISGEMFIYFPGSVRSQQQPVAIRQHPPAVKKGRRG